MRNTRVIRPNRVEISYVSDSSDETGQHNLTRTHLPEVTLADATRPSNEAPPPKRILVRDALVGTEDPSFSRSSETSVWFKDVLTRLQQAADHCEPEVLESGANVSTQPTSHGLSCTIKNLYEGPARCDCCFNWVEDYPNNVRESTEDTEETKKHALIIRNMKGHGTKRSMVIHSIQIQSPLLRTILEGVFRNYPGITAGLEMLTFKAPFRAFFYRLEELRLSVDKQTDQRTMDHLELLYKAISTDMMPTLQMHQDLLMNHVITYDYVWTLFPPGELVYTKIEDHDCVFKVSKEVTQNEYNCGIYCEYVNWDGKHFGWQTHAFSIWQFPGTMAVTCLEIYPLKYHCHSEDLKKTLEIRGHKFVGLAGQHHVSYKGLAIQYDEMASTFGIPAQLNINARIVIDEQAFVQFNPRRQLSLEPLSGQEGAERTALTPEQLLLCHVNVRGYSLDTKKWGLFSVDCIQDILWNENAFSRLVLPGAYKEVLFSLVENQIQQDNSFDDIIEGKGKGVILLLAGPPGVGKTLTAESIAEHVRAPLYSLSTSELGSNAEDAEKTLKKVFSIVTRWKAVLLLDEADVFLEKRTTEGITRNRIITVFLRMLEYYQGIMFMTTSRVNAIDPAFYSRTHITINYPNLDTETHKSVWSNFVNSYKQPICIVDSDLNSLAENVMNGRQIKNVFKIATLLASRVQGPLTMKHFQTALVVIQGQAKMEHVPLLSDGVEGQERRDLENANDATEPTKKEACGSTD